MIFLVGLGILVLLFFGFIFGLYNSLVGLKTKVDEAWSGIDVQLKRRTDLIPSLIETVKGYAKHEKSVFENVTKARSALMSAKGPAQTAKADGQLTAALKTLFAVAENYPNLKANENFKDLQAQLSETENKIAYSRQFYNANALDYNVKIKVFPNVILAGMLGFKASEFFKAEEGERKKPEVKF